MSDIVKRLGSWTGSPDGSKVVMPQVPVEVLIKAADEIERLRAVLEEIAEGTAATWISDRIHKALGEKNDSKNP